MSLLPIAHASHWLVSLLYLAPVVILVGALLVVRARDPRPGDEGDDPLGGEDAVEGVFDDDLGRRTPGP